MKVGNVMQIDYIKKRLITSMIAILLLVIALFGITYAYFTTRVKENISDKNSFQYLCCIISIN